MVEKISKIPHDKLLHSFYGMVVYLLGCMVDPIVGMWLVLVAAIGKEVIDYPRFDWVDILATITLPVWMFIVMSYVSSN